MKFKNLCKVTDSAQLTDSELNKRESLKQKIKDAFSENESTDEALAVIKENLSQEDPEQVLEAVVEVLSSTIDGLEQKLDEIQTEDPDNEPHPEDTDPEAPLEDSSDFTKLLKSLKSSGVLTNGGEFSMPATLTDSQKAKVLKLVNDSIRQNNLSISRIEF